nr:DUF1919 domain-containing protein [uncultured Oscillibacter sp.]
MRQCVIWGAAEGYEHIINQVKFEEWKSNVQCVAVLSKSKARYIKKFDGYPLVCKEDLNGIAFDYLIIPQGKDYAEIRLEALALGIPDNKIISSKVFQIPCFDFKRYASLRENPVTILSDDCWGGKVYRELNLPFTSPLINIYWPRESFCEFIKDPLFYLGKPLRMVRDGVPREGTFPIGRLGDEARSVELHFVHSKSSQEAEEHWKRRAERINKDRLFVKFAFEASDPRREEYLSVFGRLACPKICAYPGEAGEKDQDVFYSRMFERDWYYKKRLEMWEFRTWFLQMENTKKAVDLLKLLNGETDYRREE